MRVKGERATVRVRCLAAIGSGARSCSISYCLCSTRYAAFRRRRWRERTSILQSRSTTPKRSEAPGGNPPVPSPLPPLPFVEPRRPPLPLPPPLAFSFSLSPSASASPPPLSASAGVGAGASAAPSPASSAAGCSSEVAAAWRAAPRCPARVCVPAFCSIKSPILTIHARRSASFMCRSADFFVLTSKSNWTAKIPSWALMMAACCHGVVCHGTVSCTVPCTVPCAVMLETMPSCALMMGACRAEPDLDAISTHANDRLGRGP